MNLVLLGAGGAAVVIGVVLVVRSGDSASAYDPLSTGESEVSGEFAAAVSRINGVIFVAVGLWLAWLGATA